MTRLCRISVNLTEYVQWLGEGKDHILSQIGLMLCHLCKAHCKLNINQKELVQLVLLMVLHLQKHVTLLKKLVSKAKAENMVTKMYCKNPDTEAQCWRQ